MRQELTSICLWTIKFLIRNLLRSRKVLHFSVVLVHSDICGKVVFDHIDNVDSINSTIIVVFNNYISIGFTKEGYCYTDDIGEKCMLFPSKDQRDWSKFTASWYKN